MFWRLLWKLAAGLGSSRNQGRIESYFLLWNFLKRNKPRAYIYRPAGLFIFQGFDVILPSTWAILSWEYRGAYSYTKKVETFFLNFSRHAPRRSVSLIIIIIIGLRYTFHIQGFQWNLFKQIFVFLCCFINSSL